MVNKKVLVVMVLDETGSMSSIRNKTVSSFNEYLKGLYPQGKMCHVSILKFNSSKTEYVCKDVPVKDAPLLDDKNYQPDASTPLFDAVGKAIIDADKAKESVEKPDILFVVITDGEENDSRQYKREQIVDLIREREKGGWTFVYLGANQDSWSSASSMGYSSAMNTVNFAPNSAGVQNMFLNAGVATNRYFVNRDHFYRVAAVKGLSEETITYSDSNFLEDTAENPLSWDNMEFKRLVKKGGKYGKSK